MRFITGFPRVSKMGLPAESRTGSKARTIGSMIIKIRDGESTADAEAAVGIDRVGEQPPLGAQQICNDAQAPASYLFEDDRLIRGLGDAGGDFRDLGAWFDRHARMNFFRSPPFNSCSPASFVQAFICSY